LVLLDTSIVLWWLTDDKRSDKRARDITRDPATHVYVSPATTWEVILKVRRGKLKVQKNFYQLLWGGDNFKNISITHAHTLHVSFLPALHKDPYDRLLAV
jgi:PIN domain nuclease of toxin-antitoxin system